MAAQPKNVGYPAEIVPGRLYFVYMPQNTGGTPPGVPRGSLCYWLDHDLIYEPFCADFGPCNLAHTWRFCQRINHLLREGEARGVPTYLLVGPHPHKRANAAALVGIHSVLYLGKRAEEAYAPLRTLEPFAGFRDASCGVPSYTLGVADVIRGAFRAKEVGFIKWGAGEELDLDEYEHYEQVENGDLNWIVPGKLMAFSGPSATPKHYGGWRTFTPEDYVPYFRTKGVTKVVRLNKKMYEAARFTAHGIGHHELYFPDGTCPPEPVLYRFLELAEREPGALAIHCKAGLGRTGVLICSYMIKHFAFTAEEAMGYIRICRPGSVIGPQQHYLMQYAPRLLHEGRVHRAALAHAAAGGSPNVDAALRTAPPARRVINLVATSRAEDLAGAERLRRSARISSGGQSPADDSHVKSSGYSSVEEPNHIISVPGRTLSGGASQAKPSPFYATAGVSIHVQAAAGVPTPTRAATRAPAPSLQASPVRTASSGSLEGAGTPTAPASSRPPPPSSTKRVLAPNGQPRKIPLAMEFDQAVGSAALEDRDMEECEQAEAEGGESWTVSSQPVADRNYSSQSNRVGAFAAAAGRGANVFVEAFRSVVGTHRTSYTESRR